jgi:hypothetical protein
VERVAAGQFTREAIAVVKNRQFIEFCERAGDKATATLYRDIIEPDERYHHELGRSLLLRFATTAVRPRSSSAISYNVGACALGITKRCPSLRGLMSMIAKVRSSS